MKDDIKEFANDDMKEFAEKQYPELKEAAEADRRKAMAIVAAMDKLYVEMYGEEPERE